MVVPTASLVGRWNGGAPEWTLVHYAAIFTEAEGRGALLTSAGLCRVHA